MARKKKINEKMAHVAEMIANRDKVRDEIKAAHAAQLDKALRDHNASIYAALFDQFPEAGDSEIANSIGKSRNTVYLWRKDYRDNYVQGLALPVADGAPSKPADTSRQARKVTWEGMDRLVFPSTSTDLHLITYEAIGYGVDAEEADLDEIRSRADGGHIFPSWLTPELIQAESKRLDVKVALAPWN